MDNFYKVMNDTETHRGFRYYDGLNVDRNPFQPYGGNGLYYAKEDILAFVQNDSRYIRQVEIPDVAETSKGSIRPIGWSADRLILKKKYPINKDTVEMLVRQGARLHVCDDNIFLYAAAHGDYDLTKYCLDNGADPNAENGRALRVAVDKQYGAIANLIMDRGGEIHPDYVEITIINNNLEILRNMLSRINDKQSMISRGFPIAELLQRRECLLYLNMMSPIV